MDTKSSRTGSQISREGDRKLTILEDVEIHDKFLKELNDYIKDCLEAGSSPKDIRKSIEWLSNNMMTQLFIDKKK